MTLSDTEQGGYLHAEYAASLAEFGTPRFMPRSKAWILERPIRDSKYRDAMGCYPFFACQNWSSLKTDLTELEDQLVCLSAVTDPFGENDASLLADCFRDVVKPFKQHYVVDLQKPLDSFVCEHHQRNVRRALQKVNVERVDDPQEIADEWVMLYANLIRRHDITGVSAFTERSLRQQLTVPGTQVFRARNSAETVGMIVWYVNGEVGYYHLAAYSDLGYELRTSFALFWTSIEFFAANHLRWLNLGAGAGIESDATDGLNRFKRGWSTGTRTAYFCGRIFDRTKYDDIVRSSGVPATEYFPAYRAGGRS